MLLSGAPVAAAADSLKHGGGDEVGVGRLRCARRQANRIARGAENTFGVPVTADSHDAAGYGRVSNIIRKRQVRDRLEQVADVVRGA